MEFSACGGKIVFKRLARFGSGPAPEIEDAPISEGSTKPLLVDQDVLKDKYVSLQSNNVQIMAVGIKVEPVGKIKKIGWVNIIKESARSYFYSDGSEIRESIDNLPTWDGESGDAKPFYFGNYFSDEDEGAVGDFDDMNSMDCPFNDAPNLPPSYNLFEKNGFPLGKFELDSAPNAPKVRMERVDGKDSYIACLTLVGDDDEHYVAWSVAWTVVFNAKVEATAEAPGVKVTVDPTSVTTLNRKDADAAEAELRRIVEKGPSAANKTYTRHQG